MYDGPRAGWGHWVGVPIVFFTVELFVCRNIRVDAGAPEKIARDDGLVCEVVPQLEGKGGVCRAEATNEVVFKSLNCTFGRIHPMVVGFYQLKCSTYVMYEGSDG